MRSASTRSKESWQNTDETSSPFHGGFGKGQKGLECKACWCRPCESLDIENGLSLLLGNKTFGIEMEIRYSIQHVHRT
jgi:hypothetical protein